MINSTQIINAPADKIQDAANGVYLNAGSLM